MVKLLDDGSFMIPGEERAHDSLDALVTFYQQQPLRPHGDLLMQSCRQVRIGTPKGQALQTLLLPHAPSASGDPIILAVLVPLGPRPSWSLFPESPGWFFFTGIHVPGITLADLPE